MSSTERKRKLEQIEEDTDKALKEMDEKEKEVLEQEKALQAKKADLVKQRDLLLATKEKMRWDAAFKSCRIVMTHGTYESDMQVCLTEEETIERARFLSYQWNEFFVGWLYCCRKYFSVVHKVDLSRFTDSSFVFYCQVYFSSIGDINNTDQFHKDISEIILKCKQVITADQLKEIRLSYDSRTPRDSHAIFCRLSHFISHCVMPVQVYTIRGYFNFSPFLQHPKYIYDDVPQALLWISTFAKSVSFSSVLKPFMPMFIKALMTIGNIKIAKTLVLCEWKYGDKGSLFRLLSLDVLKIVFSYLSFREEYELVAKEFFIVNDRK